MKYLLLGLCFYSALAISAETIYQQTDTKGDVTYTDSPKPNAQTIIIPSETTPSVSAPSTSKSAAATSTSTTPPSAASTASDSSDSAHISYLSFSMASPVDQQTFQNQRLIPVKVSLDPDLGKDDKVQLYVDGSPYGPAVAGTDLTINQLDRGSHTVSATVVDKENQNLKSTPTITIFIQYARLGPAVP